MTSPKTFTIFAGVLGLILAIPALAGSPKLKTPSSPLSSGTAMPSTGSTSMPGGMMGSPTTDPTGMPGGMMGSPTPTSTPTGLDSSSPTPTTTPTGGASPTDPAMPSSTSSPAESPSMSPSASPSTSPSPSSSGPKKQKKSSSKTVDVNTASMTELQSVKGIGAATAKKIVAARPYNSLDELVTKKVMTATQLKTLKPNLKY